MAIFTAIATAILGAFSITSTFAIGLTAAALEVGSGIALSLLAKSISGANSTPASQFGVQGTLQAGGDIERSYIAGLGATAGSLVYANEWGNVDQTPNAYHTQVIAVSDLPVAGANATGLAQVWVNGVLCTVDWNATPVAAGYPVTEYNKDGKDHLWIKFHDGTQTGADSFLTGTVSSTDLPYESTRVGVGCAYVIATALVNDNLFSGFPQYKFALNGTHFYDPSQDSTAGGSGSQRWADPTTWGGDGDSLPAVQIYNILRGITYADQWLYGLQNMPAARLPNAAWVAAINKCRATIAGASGDEPTYRSGGEVGVNATIADTITTMLTTCQGRLTETGGVYTLHVGAPDDPVWSFDDDVILSTETQTFTPFFGLADTINGITASYPDPTQGWNSTVAPPLYNTDFEAQDGNRRLLSNVSLDFVPYAAQVQRLMLSALQEARRARRHTFTLPPEFWVLEPGDIVSYTSTRNGYEAKSFRIDGIADQANLDVMVDFTEVDPSDYDWDHDTDFHPPTTGSLVPVVPAAQPVVGFSAAGATVFDADGVARRPTLQLSWNGDQPDVQYVLWQVRLAADATQLWSGQIEDVAANEGTLPAGPYLPLTAYQVRIRYLPFSQRTTLWSNETLDGDGNVVEGDWLDVTTPDVKFTSQDIANLAIKMANLSQDLQNIQGLVTGAGGIAGQLDEIRQQIANEALAGITDQATNQTKTTLLSVQNANAAAAVITEQAARIDGDQANATALTETVASFGSAYADGLIEIDSTATGDASIVDIVLKVRAQEGDTVADSGIIIRATADGSGGTTSQILLQADQLFITDGTNTANAFTFDATSGALVLKTLRFQQLLDIAGAHISMNGNTGGVTLSA